MRILDFILSRFQWYRRARGGKWGQATGLWYGKKWHKLSNDALQWDEWWVNVEIRNFT